MRLLLDTNVVIWLLTGNRAAVSTTAAAALTDQRNTVAISAASIWEIAIKRSIGKLRLADGWATALYRLDFEQQPITALHAERVEELPQLHRDPFDRLLVAQAMVEHQMLVTPDAQIGAYDVPTLW